MLSLHPYTCMFLCLLAGAIAFQPSLLLTLSVGRKSAENASCGLSSATTRCFRVWSQKTTDLQDISESSLLATTSTPVQLYENTDALNEAIRDMCHHGKFDEAINLIHAVEETISESDSHCLKPNQLTYVAIINSLGRSDVHEAAERAEDLLHHMSSVSKVHPCCTPKGQAYSAAILAWANSKHPDAAQRADSLLSNLWSLFNNTQDKAYLPTRATYASTITAWARCSSQSTEQHAAERAEELLEEMQTFASRYPMLGPTTACFNAVLNAWSKSNDMGAAAGRSEAILKRMEGLALKGRTELQPDTISFNTLMDTLARSGQRDAPRRTEILLHRMHDLSKNLSFPCEPDTLSFNIVINSWAKSPEKAAAHRAESILRHMESRYEANLSNVAPDRSTYNTVIHAWSRSREVEAPQRADAVLRRMESAYQNGNSGARPDSITYNSLINVWAKSKHPRAGDRALGILALMKKLHAIEGRSDCRPDVFTYTSVIDAVAKQGSLKAAERAVSLLTEVEEEFMRTRDKNIKPNILTYTLTINAIARSRQHPERAEAILDRLESLFESGQLDVRADVACFNSAINAWGWSNEKGKSARAHKLYRRMMDAFESGKNSNLKPDIITCNSLLNACAFETADSEADRAATMEIAIQCLETFQASAPTYGWPNHLTFGNMLLAIGRQMPMSERRLDLAEATFWQCCKAGHVSALVISHLRNALDEKRLKSVMGSSLFVNRADAFSYDMRRLPQEWRRCAPRPRDKTGQSQHLPSRAVKKSSEAAR